MLLTDISFDFVRSELSELTPASWMRACELFDAMEGEARDWLERERVAPGDRSFRYHADARYQGQNFEVIVPLARIAPDGRDEFVRAFHAAHRREYGYDLPGRAIEVVNCRLQAVGRVPKAPLGEFACPDDSSRTPTGRRAVFHGAAHGWLDTAVYARSGLPAGSEIVGPAVIEEMSSTVLLAPAQRARVDRIGNLVIDVIRDP
jgi:N-methylhydantoinase A